MSLRPLYLRLKSIPFIEANLKMGPMTIVRFGTGLLRSKTSAVLLGTTGMGYLGVGMQAQMLGSTLGSLSMLNGMIASMSQALSQDNAQQRRKVMSTAFTLQTCTSVALLLAGLALYRPVATAVFGNSHTATFLIPVLLSLPSASLNNYFNGILFSHGRYEQYSRAISLATVLELAFFLLGAYFFGIRGAFWSIPVSALTSNILLVRQILKVEKLGDVFRLGFTSEVGRELLSSGGVMLATGTITYGLGLLIRAWIVHALDASTNGIYQVMLALSACYMPFLTQGIWARLSPKFSKEGITASSIGEWTQSLALIAFLAASAQLAMLCIPYLLISLFYTQSFLSAAMFIPLQLIGDYFYLLSQPSLGAIIGLNRRKEYLVLWSIAHAAWALTTSYFLPSLGLAAVSLGYIACNAIVAGYCIFSLSRLAPDPASRHQTRTLAHKLVLPLLAVLIQAALFYRFDSVAPRILFLGAWLIGAFLLIRGSGLQPLRQVIAKDRELNLLLNGNPVSCRILKQGADTPPFPRGSMLLIHDRPEAQSDLVQRGFSKTEFIRFEQTLPRFSLRWGPTPGLAPLVMDDCLYQNDYELLKKERLNPQPGFIVLEDQGNLIWGWTAKASRFARKELQVGGLILNKPHFWPSLLRRLRVQHRIGVISGNIPVSSPLVPLLCREGTQHLPRTWAWANPGFAFPIHVFL